MKPPSAKPQLLSTTLDAVREVMVKRLEQRSLDEEQARELEMALEELDVMWEEPALLGEGKTIRARRPWRIAPPPGLREINAALRRRSAAAVAKARAEQARAGRLVEQARLICRASPLYPAQRDRGRSWNGGLATQPG